MTLFCHGFSGNGAEFEVGAQKYQMSVDIIKNDRERIRTEFCGAHQWVYRLARYERKWIIVRGGSGEAWPKLPFLRNRRYDAPLFCAPSFQRESFFDRKKRYSISDIATNGLKTSVIDLAVGWGGSAHDSRVIEQSQFYQRMDDLRFFLMSTAWEIQHEKQRTDWLPTIRSQQHKFWKIYFKTSSISPRGCLRSIQSALWRIFFKDYVNCVLRSRIGSV